MSIKAMVYREVSRSSRRALELPGTLRTSSGEPADVTIDDLSASGFHVTTDVPLAIDEVFSLGIPGIRLHRARVVRITETGFGCRFLAPLEEDAVDQAAPQEIGVLPSEPFPADAGGVETEEDDSGKIASPLRLMLVVGLAAFAWAIVLAGYKLIS